MFVFKYEVDEFFDLAKTLECGQCFHFKKLNSEEFIVFGCNTICKIKQTNNKLEIISNIDNLDYWIYYFSLDLNYKEILENLKNNCKENNDSFGLFSLDCGKGIHLIRQPLYETCCSYILSQQNRISRIQSMVFKISELYSSNIVKLEDRVYFCFPTNTDLKKVTVDDLKKSGLGYRADYLHTFCKNWVEFKDSLTDDFVENKELLLQNRGIGEKVADCICLYGLQHYDAFPIDTWMKKVIQDEYIAKEREFILPNKNAGILQQYMFYTKRNNT